MEMSNKDQDPGFRLAVSRENTTAAKEQPQKNVETLESALVKIREQNDDLLDYNLVAKRIISNLIKRCPTCRVFMQLIDWNKNAFLVACNNVTCQSYRTPMAYINKEELALVAPELSLDRYETDTK